MGCPRHLQWSPVKGKSVALSLLGFKRKETEKRRAPSFLASSSSSRTLSLRVLFLLAVCLIGTMYWKVFFNVKFSRSLSLSLSLSLDLPLSYPYLSSLLSIESPRLNFFSSSSLSHFTVFPLLALPFYLKKISLFSP